VSNVKDSEGRIRHLFEPTEQADAISQIQGRVNAYWEQVKMADSRS
jgi:hypothetical protein